MSPFVAGKGLWAWRQRKRWRRRQLTVRLGERRRRVGFDVCRPCVRLRWVVVLLLRRLKRAVLELAADGRAVAYCSLFPFAYPFAFPSAVTAVSR